MTTTDQAGIPEETVAALVAQGCICDYVPTATIGTIRGISPACPIHRADHEQAVRAILARRVQQETR